VTTTAPVGPLGSPEDRSAPPGPAAVYVAPPGGYDEFLGPDGTVRAPWHQVADALADFGPEGLASRNDELARLLRNEGATYNATIDGRSVRRPWALDPVPLVLDQTTWQSLEAAVVQRVTLLDLVVDDLYGPRTLLTRGNVPAELVFANPAFLRPAAGSTVPGVHRLFTTAVDVVREAGGGYRAVTDRTQAPSGLGYALVNRSALSRVFPTLHRASGVERLAGFVRAIRAGVAGAAPDGVDEPRVVILTPGPLSETYFEHAYLAAYLGYPLVEGRDLVVQNNRVWLRSLAGLDPVDVVIRRVDDAWCDPVELRADSLLGVPGLMEVVRRGRVAVLNPLGSGILESPALAGLLDDLAPALLGEELALRGPQSWWCGRPDGLSHVLASMDRLMLLPVQPAAGFGPVLPDLLTDDQREDLRARVRARPADWVGQEILAPSTMPTVTVDGRLEARPVILRTFAVADDSVDGVPGHGVSLLPGGLTRVGADADSPVVNSRGDGTSKDTWVVSAEPAFQQSPWLPTVRCWSPNCRSPFPGGWRHSCSSSDAVPSTRSWSSGSSARSWPDSTSRSAPAMTGGPSRCRYCCPHSGRRRGSIRCPSPTPTGPGTPVPCQTTPTPSHPSPREPLPWWPRASCPTTGGPSTCCSTKGWPAVWCPRSASWSRRPTPSVSNCRRTPGS